jgi:hypothetical protein
MYPVLLSRKQYNEVYEILEHFGLNPNEFDREEASNRFNASVTHSKLVHRETGHFFYFGMNREQSAFMPIYSPGAQTPHASPYDYHNPMEVGGEWSQIVQDIRQWASLMSEELEVEDLWEQLKKQQEALTKAFSPGLDDTPLTTKERVRFSEGLARVETLCIEMAHKTTASPEDVRSIEKTMKAHFVYLDHKSEVIGRKDLIIIVMGVMFALAVDPSLPGEWRKTFLGQVFGYVQQFIAGLLGNSPT